MDIEKMIEQLNDFNENHISVLCGSGQCACGYLCDKDDCVVVRATTALSTLQAENEKLREKIEDARLEGYAKGLGEMSEENENLRAEVESLKKEHCAGCSVPVVEAGRLRDLNEAPKLRAELEQVKAERDAAVEDVAAIIGDVEEIRRGYGVDNADADGAFAELCETYCANKGRFCYAECEKYHCKNFKWRGI